MHKNWIDYAWLLRFCRVKRGAVRGALLNFSSCYKVENYVMESGK